MEAIPQFVLKVNHLVAPQSLADKLVSQKTMLPAEYLLVVRFVNWATKKRVTTADIYVERWVNTVIARGVSNPKNEATLFGEVAHAILLDNGIDNLISYIEILCAQRK